LIYAIGMQTILEQIKIRHAALLPVLNESQYRIYLACEAKAIGWGGVTTVSQATNSSRNTISLGLSELVKPVVPVSKPVADVAGENKVRLRTRGGRCPVDEDVRQRKVGGGRKRTSDIDTTLKKDLDMLLEPFAAGDPCSPLRWTCKSVSALTAELANLNHKTSTRMVHELLVEMRYTMQSNRKCKESGSHPDRNDQFIFINEQVKHFQEVGEPVISVDTKKKEIVGEFANKGSTWRPEGNPEKVNTHDFPDPDKGRAAPYGIYDIANNTGFVNVGISADTAEFAVESIRRWWLSMGKESYADATKLLITADGGGSNGSRVRLWKTELQNLANEMNLEISVSHFPPGTSKWNKIEHRMFSYISQNWRGKPLVSIETIVNLIGSTKTKKGLTIQTSVDTKEYTKGIKITDAEIDSLSLEREAFHGEWNYTLRPNKIAQFIL
jgi:Rhodopirellula transposase DDE domain